MTTNIIILRTDYDIMKALFRLVFWLTLMDYSLTVAGSEHWRELANQPPAPCSGTYLLCSAIMNIFISTHELNNWTIINLETTQMSQTFLSSSVPCTSLLLLGNQFDLCLLYAFYWLISQYRVFDKSIQGVL